MKPSELSAAELAFPAGALKHMPDYADIPDEFKSHHPLVKFASDWFFHGLDPLLLGFIPRDGIDPSQAFDHLQMIQSSFAPKHEHKQASVAYLADLWFASIAWAPTGAGIDDLKVYGESTRDDWVEHFESVN